MVDYKNGEKLDKEKEKAGLETLLNYINIKLKSTNRPPYVPEGDLNLDNLNALWDNLIKEELNRDEWLEKEKRKQERLKLLNSKFNDKANKLEEWIREKEVYLNVDEVVNSIADAKNKLSRCDAFVPEYNQSETRLNQVLDLGKEILSLDAKNSDDVSARMNVLTEDWKGLDGKHKHKTNDLSEKLKTQIEMDRLRLLFATKSKIYNKFLKETINDASGREFGDNLEAVLNFEEKLNDTDVTFDAKSNKKLGKLEGVWNALQELGVKDNRYTCITYPDLVTGHNNLLSALAKRKEDYHIEKQKQLAMEEKRKEFALRAKEFVDHLDQRKIHINSLNTEHDPKVLTQKIDELYAEGNPEEHLLNGLKELTNEMAQMGIRSNSHTKHTLPSLTLLNKGFANEIRLKRQQLYNEQLLKDLYLSNADKINTEVQQVIPTLTKHFDNTLEGAKLAFRDWTYYKSSKSAEIIVDRDNLKALFDQITNELGKTQRPPFEPPHGLRLLDVEEHIHNLHNEENNVDNSIRDELARQERISKALTLFNSNIQELEEFVHDKETYYNSKEEIKDLNDAKKNLRYLEFNLNDVQKRRDLNDSVVELSHKLSEENYKEKDETSRRAQEIDHRFKNLESLNSQKNDRLTHHLNVEIDKENKRLKFSNAARDYNRFVHKSIEAIEDLYFGNSLETVEEYAEELKMSDSKIHEEAHELKHHVEEVAKELADLQVNDNRHTDHDLGLQSIHKLSEDLENALSNRRKSYDVELNLQRHNDGRRMEFAEKAKNFVDWIDEQVVLINNLGGEHDEKLHKISEIYNPSVGAGHLNVLIALESDMAAHEIYGNKHTPFTISILKDRNSQFDNFVSNTISSLNEDKEVDSRRVEQEKEFAKRERITELENNLEGKKSQISLFINDADSYHTDDLARFKVNELENYISEYRQFANGFDSHKSTITEIEHVVQLLAELGVDKKEIEVDIHNKFNHTHQAHQNRTQHLGSYSDQLKVDEKLCKDFGEATQIFYSFLDVQKDKSSQALEGENLDESLRKLGEVKSVLESSGREKLEQLEDLDRKINERNILENPFTQYSLRSLRNTYDSLSTSNKKKLEATEHQIEAKQQTGISAEEYSDIRESFEHFDKDKDGKLNALDFYGVLSFLGENASEEGAAQLLKQLDIDEDGLLNFEEYKNYIVTKRSDTDTFDSYLSAFSTIAQNKDFITEDDMRRANMPPEKIGFLVSSMPHFENQESGYDYKAWLQLTHGH